jgi:hypothetical protein
MSSRKRLTTSRRRLRARSLHCRRKRNCRLCHHKMVHVEDSCLQNKERATNPTCRHYGSCRRKTSTMARRCFHHLVKQVNSDGRSQPRWAVKWSQPRPPFNDFRALIGQPDRCHVITNLTQSGNFAWKLRRCNGSRYRQNQFRRQASQPHRLTGWRPDDAHKKTTPCRSGFLVTSLHRRLASHRRVIRRPSPFADSKAIYRRNPGQTLHPPIPGLAKPEPPG